MEKPHPIDDQSIKYNDRKRQYQLEFGRYYYRFYGYLSKFPRYSRQYYMKNISSLPNENEFKKEKQIWLTWTPLNGFGNTSIIFMAAYLFFSLKYLTFMCYTMANVDFNHPEWNLEMNDNDRHKQFVCMTTNCSQLSAGTELADDIIQLPVFRICEPQLSWSFSPFITLHHIGLIIVGLYTFYIFVSGFVEPLLAMRGFYPFRATAFFACPNIVRRLDLGRTRTFCSEFAASYENYLLYRCSKREWSRSRGSPVGFRAPIKQGPRISIDHLQCLPINASKWWHEQLVLFFPLGPILFNLAILVAILVVNELILQLISNSNQNYEQLINRQDLNGSCSIWTDEEEEETVDLKDVIGQYNVASLAEYVLSLISSNLLLSGALNGIYQTAIDIQVNLNELKFFLEMATQLGELRAFYKQKDSSCGCSIRPTNHRPDGCPMFAAIRAKFMQNSTYSWGLLVSRPLERKCNLKPRSKLDYKLACQEFSLELLDDFGWSDEVYANLLERIQIYYWNFAHLISEYDRPFSGLLFLCYLINFGFSLLSVYLSRRFLTSHLVSLVVSILAVMVLNVYIASASIVHSEAKQIEFKLWSLVALNEGESNERIRHSNHLARKQLVLMDAIGGLGLRAFGQNVTYVRILEVSFWTTSIILFAYTRH